MTDAGRLAEQTEQRGIGGRLWLGVFLIALALYALTANRGIQWQDSGWQQCRIIAGTIEHPLGLALTHPLQFHLGRLAVAVLPVSPTYATTLVSGVAAAVAVANVALVVWLVCRRWAPTAAAGLSLLLAHTFWQHATHTESYTLVAALLSTEWLLLTRFAQRGRYESLVALSAVNGMGVANHLLAGLATPINLVVITAVLWRTPRAWRWGLAAVTAWLVGASPYLLLVVQAWVSSGDFVGTLRSALVGNFGGQVLNTDVGGRLLLLSAAYVGYNLPNLGLPLAIIGLGRPVRQTPKLLRRVLVAEVAVYLAFVLRYSIVDQYTFFVPVYALLAVHVGLGLATTLDWLRSAAARKVAVVAVLASLVLNPAIYLTTASVLRSRGWLSGLVGNKPYRDGYRAFFVPWGVGEQSAPRLVTEAHQLAGSGGVVIVTDSMARFALAHADMTAETPAGFEWRIWFAGKPGLAERQALLRRWLAEDRRVVLAPYDRDDPAVGVPVAEWVRHGDLYVLTGLDVPTTQPAE